MLVRGCGGGELRHSLAERTKALAARCHALRSPAARADQRSPDRRRPRHRKSQTRWYVKVSCNMPRAIEALSDVTYSIRVLLIMANIGMRKLEYLFFGDPIAKI